MPALIMKNHCVTQDATQYMVLNADGSEIKTITARPAIAGRYARRFSLRPISPMQYFNLMKGG